MFMHRSALVDFKKNYFFHFMMFLCFTMIFEIFIQNKCKRKREKPLRKPPREVIYLVLRVQRGKILDFRVQGENVNSAHSLWR